MSPKRDSLQAVLERNAIALISPERRKGRPIDQAWRILTKHANINTPTLKTALKYLKRFGGTNPKIGQAIKLLKAVLKARELEILGIKS